MKVEMTNLTRSYQTEAKPEKIKLEAEKAVIENELKQFAQELENMLTNGTSFSFITM
jgi:hypothetical protein